MEHYISYNSFSRVTHNVSRSCHLSHPSVGLPVCLSVWRVYYGKMADWIWMPFRVVSGVGQVTDVLDGGLYPLRGRGVIGGFSPHWFEWRF